MVIQHNISAINSWRSTKINSGNTSRALEKLSSGSRINRAGDDAAGLAISEKMHAQIRGLSMAASNTENAINLIQTAEGGLAETHAILQRMRELAVQSANGTYANGTDRQNIAKEYEAQMKEMDRIAASIHYNGIKLLDGSTGRHTISNARWTSGDISSKLIKDELELTLSGFNRGVGVTITKEGEALGLSEKPCTVTVRRDLLDSDPYYSIITSASITIGGKTYDCKPIIGGDPGDGGWYLTWAKDADVARYGLSIQSASEIVSTRDYEEYMAELYGGAEFVDLSKDFSDVFLGMGFFDDDGVLLGGLGELNYLSDFFDSEKGGWQITSGTMRDPLVWFKADVAGLYPPGEYGITDFYSVLTPLFEMHEYLDEITCRTYYPGVTLWHPNSALSFQVGANGSSFPAQLHLDNMNSKNLGSGGQKVADTSIATLEDANNAIEILDLAINQVSESRAALGALQNRLEHTFNNLGVAKENLQAAESSIRDVDMAEEMMALTKNNILTQAAQSMLAQANQLPQGILQLLR